MAKDNDTYLVRFNGKNVDLFDYHGKIIRRFVAAADVVNAQVNGSGKDATIAITMKDGKFVIYKSSGAIIKRG